MRRVLAFLAVLVAGLLPAATAIAAPSTDSATTTPIKHLVMLMQDNHSFDNYFGTYPGADGIPPGVCQRLNLTRPSTDGCIKPFRIRNTPAEDLSQGVGIQKRQYDGGKMDGFVAAYRRLGQDGTSALGYYDGADLPYYWNVAQDYVLFDRFFSSTAVGSRESYLYWLAGKAPPSSQPLKNGSGYDQLPTIFDRLNAKHVSAKFYVENLDIRLTAATKTSLLRSSSPLIKVPLLSMRRFNDGGPMAGKVVDLNEYYRDLRTDTLPAVSYIVTSGSSENPPARVAVGQKIVEKLTRELIQSSSWSSSAFMWTYDGWGGWYDHVPPPKVDARGYGFRVPALLVSPYAKRGVVDHTVLDYTAMLKFIETNWTVDPLATRDSRSPGLASAFDFSSGPRPAALIALSRNPETTALPNAQAAPVIYAAYGSAVGVVVALTCIIVFAKPPLRRLLAVPLWVPGWPSPVIATGYQPRRALMAGRDMDGYHAWTDWYKKPRHGSPKARRALMDEATAQWVAWYEATVSARATRAQADDVDDASREWVAWYQNSFGTPKTWRRVWRGEHTDRDRERT